MTAELADEDIAGVAATYDAWRGDPDAGEYRDIAGFRESATLEEIRKHGYVLRLGRYVGAEAARDDGERFEETIARLVAQLREGQTEVHRLDEAVATNLALEAVFGRPVDLVVASAIKNPYFREYVEPTKAVLYAA